MLQAPPKMVESVTDWALPLVARAYAGNEVARRKNYAGMSDSKLEQLAKKAPHDVNYMQTISKDFPTDLRGWRYGDRLDKLLARRVKSAKGILKMVSDREEDLLKSGPLDPNVKRMMDFLRKDATKAMKAPDFNISVSLEIGSSALASYWRPGQRTLEINVRWGDSLSSVAQTIRHEMLHVAQTLLQYSADAAIESFSGHPFGAPKRRVRTPKYDQNTSPDRTTWALDDGEFFPLLSDSIASMKKTLSRTKEEDKVRAFKAMTAQTRRPQWPRDKFFSALKANSRPKYKRALSLAYTEIFGR